MSLRMIAGIVLGAAIGLAAGLGTYTFVYARGWSYLTNDPAACANCHIMGEQLLGWMHSSHRSVAVCNDCHTPPGLVGKYWTKAQNGFWHSFYFTLGGFPEPIRITPHNRAITERACRSCHQAVVEAIEGPHGRGPRLECVRCHGAVGHR